ncbi:hypothetical protein PQR72_02520 [Paraburkholderia madseniana]|uniref:hypothetical protein n=1 Tax=Paraburkholderia madseniana TaxID=2599607 RepID=UPI0015C5691D|nr:hypothetical protein [Paraburkholderia madseniana]NPT64866.1 hypothetical protein [Paraburkholderia madseniana]
MSTIFAFNFDNLDALTMLWLGGQPAQALLSFITSLINVWDGRLLETGFVNKVKDLHGAFLLRVALKK